MIYVVIPVHNRKAFTRNCLNSLLRQDQNNFKVIVVDDGSSDGTSEMLNIEFPEVILLHGNGNLWWAGSINKGIRYVLSICQPEDYILTLNDDLVVHPNYISQLEATANSHPGTIIGSVETTINEPTKIKSGGILVNWMTAKVNVINRNKHLYEFPKNYTVEVSRVTGRGTLFPTQVFREVGLFDEKYIKQCADTELPMKANIKYGYPILVSYDAIVLTTLSNKEDVNTKEYFSLSDAGEYFFGIRSHYNLKNRYWISRSVAPNNIWFLRYLSLNVLRTIYHFIVRLKFRDTQK